MQILSKSSCVKNMPKKCKTLCITWKYTKYDRHEDRCRYATAHDSPAF